MASNTTIYTMKGTQQNPPFQVVTWTVYNTPDFAGAYSGYGAGQIDNIVIDNVEQAANSVQYNVPTGPASGDLAQQYPNPTVVGLQGTPIADVVPTTNQNLVFNGTVWTPQSPSSGPPSGAAGGDLSGTYPNPTVSQLQGVPVSNTVPTVGQVLEYNGTFWIATSFSASFTAGGDLSGSNTNQTVTGLQTHPVSNMAPTIGQVLEWNGSVWIPFSLPTALPPDGSAGGDLSGTYPNPTVAKLQGTGVSNVAPTLNQVLKFNGTIWVAAALPTALPPDGYATGDLGGSYPNPSVVKLQGVSINSTVPLDGMVLTYDNADGYWHGSALPASFPPSGSASGDLSGFYPNPTVAKIQGIAVNATAPTTNQVLIYNGSVWIPASIPASAPTGSAGGDLSSNYPNPTVVGLQGNPTPAPTGTNTVLTWTGSALMWATTGGGGSPTGPAGGDLGGSYPNPTVVNIQGRSLSTTPPMPDQALVWSGTQWVPDLIEAVGAASGDLSGSFPGPNVIALQNNPVKHQTLSSATDGYVLTWVNADGYWEAKPAGSGGSASNMHTVAGTKTTTYTTTSADDVIPFDTSGGSFTISLDAAPPTGLTHFIVDVGLEVSTNPLTISGNGKTILTQAGAVSSVSINTNSSCLKLLYNGSSWSLV